MRIFGMARSLFTMASCIAFLGVLAPLSLYLFVIPWIAVRGEKGKDMGPRWVAAIARSLVFFLRAGGARFRFEGTVDCEAPSVVIMNHQSLLDIPPLIHVLGGRLPRFVVRAKYVSGIPTVSPAIRYLDCIPVDPKKDRAGAVLALQRAAREGINHAVLVYPEGHRSKDGELLPFRTAGLTALLQEKPLKVWTLVCDGLFRLRTLSDTLFRLGEVRCTLRVVDGVMSPEDPAMLPQFIADREKNLARALKELRAEPSS